MTKTTAILFVIFTACFAPQLRAQPTTASTTAPTEAQLVSWDKRMRPGQYQIDEYAVDVHGEPVESSRKITERCLAAPDLASFARGPLNVPRAWNCGGETFEISLTNRLFRNVMVCGGSGERPVMGIMDVSLGPDAKVALASYIRAQFGSGKPTLVEGRGGRLIRLGDCLASTDKQDAPATAGQPAEAPARAASKSTK
jgi:hypothetical protein